MADGTLTADLQAALAAINATVAPLPSITGADSATLATLAAQIAAAQIIAQQVFAYYDNAVAQAGLPTNFASGTSPATMIANVTMLLAATQGLNMAFDCLNKLGRLAINVAQVTG